MKRQLNRMRLQLSLLTSKAPSPQPLSSSLTPQVEQRLEPAKRAAHNVHKRLQACLQGQSGTDMEKRCLFSLLLFNIFLETLVTAIK
uniref:Uncharacterized protein n=1 Tax=Monodelphis domestica TaxID=13616 RepID=A0A5F8HC32_MONDO